MKTFGSNSLSTFFYYLTKIAFIGALGFFLFVLLSMLLGFISYWFGWENGLVSLSMSPGFHLQIIPLNASIKGEMGLPMIIPILVFSTALFYMAVLWFLSQLFKDFMAQSIFKEKVVKLLFALSITFFVAAVGTFCMMIFSPHSDSDVFAASLLLIISAILFFIKEIFKQGVVLQEENNLTI